MKNISTKKTPQTKGGTSFQYGRVSVTVRDKYSRIRWRENGKPCERSSTSFQDACNLAREIESRLAAGNIGSPSATFAAVANAAFQRREFPTYSDESFNNLWSILRIHIIPSIGAEKARTVSNSQCQKVLADIYTAKYSKHTVAKARKILMTIGNYGVQHGIWVAGKQPTVNLRTPHSKTEDMDTQLAPIPLNKIPDDSQVEALITAAWKIDPRYGFSCELAAYSGLRWAEILALKPSDINLDARTITVMKSRRECANGTFTEKGPKTSSGKRSTVIAERSVKKLKEFIEGKPNDDFLVCTKTGNGIRRSNWSNIMKRLRKESGYPEHMTFHSLRHYCASSWCRLGVLMPDISHMLGHANTYITETLYLHGDSGSVERAKALTKENPKKPPLNFVPPTIDKVIASGC